VQTYIQKCKIAKRNKKTWLTGRSPLKRRRPAINCRAIGDEE
jgi:hypothetical protein